MSSVEPTRRMLEDVTGKAFATSAYQCADDEWMVQGKFCRCSYLGNDCWDVWLCNPDNIRDGLTQRRVRSIHARIIEFARQEVPFRELTGEGVYPVISTELLTKCAPLLGIKRRRKVSREVLETLAIARKEKAPAATEALKNDSVRGTDDKYTSAKA